MRYLLVTTVFLSSVAAVAQELPQEASPLTGGIYDTATNVVTDTGAALPHTGSESSLLKMPPSAVPSAAAPSGLSIQNSPQETMPLVTGAYEEKTGVPAAVPAAPPAAPPADQSNAARVDFLMDTGVQYMDEGDFQTAEQAYLRALEASPGNPNIRFQLGTLYIQMKRYKDAVAVLTAMAAEFPENPLVHNNLAWIYSTGGEMKNGKLAIRHAREAILSAPVEASMWNTLAEAYYVSGEYENALRASDYAVDLLRMQKGQNADVSEFEAQRARIRRAAEVGRQFLSPAGK